VGNFQKKNQAIVLFPRPVIVWTYFLPFRSKATQIGLQRIKLNNELARGMRYCSMAYKGEVIFDCFCKVCQDKSQIDQFHCAMLTVYYYIDSQ
jgi:hypothetical protein